MVPHHRAPCSCFPQKVSLQLSSEQSIGVKSCTVVMERIVLIRKSVELLLEVHQYCFGRLSAPNNRPITDCLVQDASSFNKSHVVTIVKSQWYDGRFVTLLL